MADMTAPTIYERIRHERETDEAKNFLAQLSLPLLGTLCMVRTLQTALAKPNYAHEEFAQELLRDLIAAVRSKGLEAHAELLENGEPVYVSAEIYAEVCSDCGCALVHVAGQGVTALVCPHCDADSSALMEEVVN
jgi:hypothetical protein